LQSCGPPSPADFLIGLSKASGAAPGKAASCRIGIMIGKVVNIDYSGGG
jgi:hypothetical protein